MRRNKQKIAADAKVEYRVIERDDIAELVAAVETWLAKGWRLQGGVAVVPWQTISAGNSTVAQNNFCQAITRGGRP